MTQANLGLQQETRRRIGWFGWSIVLGSSLLLFLLPGNYTPYGLASDVWVAMMVSILLLFWLSQTLGVGLLIVRYLPFFQQIKGPLLFLALFSIGLRLLTLLQMLDSRGWFFSQLYLLLAGWSLTLIGVMLLALSVYLWYQDRTVRLVGVTFLAVVWLLVIYTRWRGPEQVIHDTFRGVLPPELFGLICFTQFVFVLTPLFFIGHSLRLLYREWTRADMLLLIDHRLNPVAEETP